jgi:fluoroquinolone transport system permease protein
MANRLIVLVKGELQRLNKYNMTSISILVAIIWGVILFFVNSNILEYLLPLVLMMDATMMAIMYVGSVMFFEKSESTISTMLVTPVSNKELLLSKLIANTLHNMFASALIIIVFVIFKDVQLNYFLIILAIVISTAFHTLLGIVMAYYQKDFTGMLVNIMIFMFALGIPSILFTLGVISGDVWEFVLLLNPIQSATLLINGAFTDYGFVFDYKYYFSLGYLLIGGILLYKLIALPRFQDYAVKESGV